MDTTDMRRSMNANRNIWIGIAVGAAVGIGIALSRRNRHRTPWEHARHLSKRVTGHSGDLADTTRDIVDRVKHIYEQGRRVVEDAGELWEHSRKLVGV
jgi:hypothetical protein